MWFRFVVWFIMIFGGIGLGLLLDYSLFPSVLKNVYFHLISFVVGILLLILVVKISKNTGRTLAKHGRNGKIKRMDTNVLVKSGAYKYMRHPMHLGLLLFPLVFALLSGSLSFILIIYPVEVIFMLLMIKFMEEPEAIKKFGDEYKKYMKDVPAFCFKKECIKELLKKVDR